MPLAIDDAVVEVELERALLGGMSGCNFDYRSVRYDRRTRMMTWPGCTPVAGQKPGGDYDAVARVLDPAEASRVENALRAIWYTAPPPKGPGAPACAVYDGLDYFMQTTNAAGAVVSYSAYGINCPDMPTAPGVAQAYEVLRDLPKW